MKLTDYVLELHAKGKLSKEATQSALAMNKKAEGGMFSATSTIPWPTLAAGAALAYGVPRAMGAVEGAISHYMTGKSDSQKNAIFQQLMQQHPNLQGKDPIRAKANFDYLASEAPHLLDHPILLGDHVANMTSLGTTDPATLNMLATMTKSRNEANREHGGDNMAGDIGKAVGNQYIAHAVKMPPAGQSGNNQ